MPSWVVSGADNLPEVNGTYVESGVYNGKTSYTFEAFYLRWSFSGYWEIGSTSATAYIGTGADLPANPWGAPGPTPYPTVAEYVPSPHDLSGQVTVDAVGQDGVTVSLTGDATDSTTTAGSGLYTFADLDDGDYVVTPTLAGYSYTPASRDVTLLGADATGQDFTGVRHTHAAAAGSILYIDGAAVAEVTRLTPSKTGDALDVTGHGAPDAVREWVGGLRGGELRVEALYTAAGYALLRAQIVSRAASVWRIEYPNGDWWEGSGLCTSLPRTAPVDDAMKVSATVKLTGRPTCSWQT